MPKPVPRNAGLWEEAERTWRESRQFYKAPEVSGISSTETADKVADCMVARLMGLIGQLGLGGGVRSQKRRAEIPNKRPRVQPTWCNVAPRPPSRITCRRGFDHMGHRRRAPCASRSLSTCSRGG